MTKTKRKLLSVRGAERRSFQAAIRVSEDRIVEHIVCKRIKWRRINRPLAELTERSWDDPVIVRCVAERRSLRDVGDRDQQLVGQTGAWPFIDLCTRWLD